MYTLSLHDALPICSGLPHMREANITVNVLLRELEEFNGVVIFAARFVAKMTTPLNSSNSRRRTLTVMFASRMCGRPLQIGRASCRESVYICRLERVASAMLSQR